MRQAEIAAATERSAAEIELRTVLGLTDPGELQPQGDVDLPEDQGPIDLEVVSAAASDSQPEVRAKAAASRRPMRRLPWPMRISGPTSRPARRSRLTKTKRSSPAATLQVPLQLFNRKQGELLQAEAERAKAAADLEQTRLKVRLEIRSTWVQYAAAQKTIDLLAGDVLPASQRHLQDAQRLLDAGQIDLLKLVELRRRNLLIRQQLLDAQRSGGRAPD